MKSKYQIGQAVYLVTDKEQHKRMIIGITIRQTGVMYDLAFGSTSTWHYEIEVSEEEDVLTKTT